MSIATISGKVTRIVFSGDDDFVIAQVTKSCGDQTTIKGNIPGLRLNAEVDITGKKETHSKYGDQISVTGFSQRVPQDPVGIARFFERVDGIGEARARLLAKCVMEFGHGIERWQLEAAPGVPPEIAQRAADAWFEDMARNSELIKLQAIGLTPLQADRCVDRWGGSSTQKVESNPYILCEIPRIGFKLADGIAREHFNIEKTDRRRVKEGVLYVLSETAKSKGHSALPRKVLLGECERVLGVPKNMVDKTVSWLMEKELLVQSHDLVFTRDMDRFESDIAERIFSIRNGPKYTHDIDPSIIDGLTDEQKDAVYASAAGGVLILTGGPGTGKTHTTRAIIKAWKAKNTAVEKPCDRCNSQGCRDCDEKGYTIEGVGRPVYLAAPTGRAAKRMEEMSGYPAQTIHRLLKCRPAHNDGFTWGRKLKEIDGLIIIDEASMLDTEIASILLERVSDKSTVVFVGDPDQLPSIGSGFVLQDLIDSGVCESVKLSVVHRQKAGSGIIQFAYDVQAARTPSLKQAEDLKVIRVHDSHQIEGAIKACFDRLAQADFRLPDGEKVNVWEDVQVLSPMKKRGSAATSETINDIVQGEFFGDGDPHIKLGSLKYHVTDRVMQTSNDYEKEVFNGDVGFIRRIDQHATGDDPCAFIEFDGREVGYTRSDLASQISRGYCVTIHKSQGSEYPVVILVITGAHHFMLERTLLYTGITRASKLAILIYDNKGLKRSIENNPSINRYRALCPRIKEQVI